MVETLLVAAWFFGRPVAGLRLDGLQRDVGRPVKAAVWIAAALVACGYCGLSILGAPVIATQAVTMTPLKALAVLLAVVTGFFEEGFFRRLTMDTLRRKGHGSVVQVLASGLIFGVAHMGFALAGGNLAAGAGAAAYTGILGIALGLLYIVGDRNLLPCIAAHLTINLLLEPGLGLMAAGAR